MQEPEIRTRRLRLRRWRTEDVAPYAAICADPEVMRHIGDGATRTQAQAERAIALFEREWEASGYGLFAVERVSDGAMIGFTGFSDPTFLPEIMPAVEIGWRFARSTWGQGLATEAARAALHFGRARLGLADVVCIFQVANLGSARIAHKLGLRFDRETVDPSCGRRVEVHRAAG